MDEAVIAIEGLVKRFGRRVVLDRLDWSVPRGSVVGLVGRNGAGKTTLLTCLLGLQRRAAGRVQVLGQPCEALRDQELLRIGYVPQQPVFVPWLSARDMTRYVGAFYPGWDQALADELLGRWELDPGCKVGALSAGQVQTLAIILAMAHRPELLVLDEPAASLDPVARRRFLAAVLELVDRGATVLFSTHLAGDLQRVADRIALLSGGRIALDGPLDEILERTKRLRVNAGRPLPDSLPLEGLVSVTVRGNAASLCVHGDVAAAVERLRGEYGAEVAVDDLDLEDLLVEWHR